MLSRSLAFRRSPARIAVGIGILIGIALVSWNFIGPSLVHADHGLPHGTILARGTFAETTDVKIKSTLGGESRVINVKDSQEVIVQEVTIAPGAQTGWQSHHGPVVVVVKAGTMTLYQHDDPACEGETFTAGEVFVDPGQGNVHNARNEGSLPTDGVILYATYFDVPAGAGPAIPGTSPGTCAGF